MFEWVAYPEAWVALLTLTALEIVLGIDNIVFISILVGRLPVQQRRRARVLGLGLAMFTRILLLLSIAWLMRLTYPLVELDAIGFDLTGRELILIGGGLFLLAKSTHEIHYSLEGDEDQAEQAGSRTNMLLVLIQIAIIDIVFSFDSVITAVGMANHLPVMVLAIVIAVIVMMFAVNPISDFVDEHPTVKMLALSFLILVGVALIGEGLEFHIPKGYIYFAMAFSLAVETLNIRQHKKRRQQPVHLRQHVKSEED